MEIPTPFTPEDLDTKNMIEKRKYQAGRLLRVLEITVLIAVIAAICGFYILPTLFYVLPPIDQVNQHTEIF